MIAMDDAGLLPAERIGLDLGRPKIGAPHGGGQRRHVSPLPAMSGKPTCVRRRNEVFLINQNFFFYKA
jgi:hypothetical protein